MCTYVDRTDLKNPREDFIRWITKVQKQIKKKYKITFSYVPIGSAKRKMVVKQCNRDYFDLDYQIILQKIPMNLDINSSAKVIKDWFRTSFDDNKPVGFSYCQDSTQALTTLNKSKGYGYDVIITTYDCEDNFYILYNKKNTNNANNEDYMWAKRSDMEKHRKNYRKIKGPEMHQYLRDIYIKKRHKHKDDVEPCKKKSYQLLNEAVNETLVHFGVK